MNSNSNHVLDVKRLSPEVIDMFMSMNVDDDEIVIDNVLLERMLAAIHNDKRTKFTDFPILNRVFTDENYQNLAVERVLKGGPIGEYTAKILHAACLLGTSKKAAGVMARFFFFAANREELIKFVSLALTLTPFHPLLMTHTVQRVLEGAASQPASHFVSKRNADGQYAVDLRRARFVFNLLTLLKWQKMRDCRTDEERKARDEDECREDIKYLGISMMDLDDCFREDLMSWGLRYVEEVGRRRSLCDASMEVIDAFLSLMRAVQPFAQIRLQHPHRLLRQFCALIVGLLRLVNKEEFGTKYDRVDFVYRCYAVTGIFFSYVVGANKNSLITALFDEAFENSATLFGTSMDVTHVYPELVDFDRFVVSGLLPFGAKAQTSRTCDGDYSCLHELRSSPFRTRSAAAMAHTGVLSGRHRRTAESRVGESETLRILIFMHMVENLCIPNDDGYDLDTYRHLGSVLTDRFCQDGLTAAFVWSEWRTERENVSKYVEMAKRMDVIPFLNDFLLMMADVGIAGVLYALPVVKACFAAVLIQLETTPLKDAKISASTLLRVADILAVFIVAKFLPKVLELMYEIMREITNHEACVLLTQLWNVIQAIVPESVAEIDAAKERIATNDFLHTTSAGKDLISVTVLVVQRNVDRLGGFLPLMLDAFGRYSERAVEEIDEEDWR